MITSELELLDKKIILKELNSAELKKLNELEILDVIPSTNDYLMQKIKTEKNKIIACFAEQQTAGKGRQGRSWVSPFGSNIYLSLSWIFNKNLSELSGLSLVIAVAIIEALAQYGITTQLSLKWPNDVLWEEKKLAGVLIETFGEPNNKLNVIIGVGLNVAMPKDLKEKITRPWIDLYQILDKKPERNKLAGLLLKHLITTLTQFETNGASVFLKKWQEYDIAKDRKVTISNSVEDISGLGRGIDENGCFLLEDENKKIHAYSVGEISLRI